MFCYGIVTAFACLLFVTGPVESKKASSKGKPKIETLFVYYHNGTPTLFCQAKNHMSLKISFGEVNGQQKTVKSTTNDIYLEVPLTNEPGVYKCVAKGEYKTASASVTFTNDLNIITGNSRPMEIDFRVILGTLAAVPRYKAYLYAHKNGVSFAPTCYRNDFQLIKKDNPNMYTGLTPVSGTYKCIDGREVYGFKIDIDE